MLASQGIGFVATTLILVFTAEPISSSDSLVWAAFAGVSGVAGLFFFYLALARGTMGIVAPLAALIGAGLPVLLAIVGGESVALPRLLGIALALVAVVLISLPARSRGASERRAVKLDIAELPIVLLSGLGFAGFFIGIDRATSSGGMWWPLTVVRVCGIAMVVGGIAFAAWRLGAGTWRGRFGNVLGVDRFRASGRTFVGALPLFLIAGAGDMGGNAFFVLARGADAFSVAVVLASLYPIVTTVLAAIVLHERLRPVQLAGVALATLSVPLLR